MTATTAATGTSRWRRFLQFPLTRILVAAVIFAVPLAALAATSSALGLEPLPITLAASSAVTALLALCVVGVVIEHRSAGELGLHGSASGREVAGGFGLGAALQVR